MWGLCLASTSATRLILTIPYLCRAESLVPEVPMQPALTPGSEQSATHQGARLLKCHRKVGLGTAQKGRHCFYSWHNVTQPVALLGSLGKWIILVSTSQLIHSYLEANFMLENACVVSWQKGNKGKAFLYYTKWFCCLKWRNYNDPDSLALFKKSYTFRDNHFKILILFLSDLVWPVLLEIVILFMNTICPFRLLVYQIISSRLELTALTITWYTVPCLLIRASSDLFNVLFYFLPQPALSEVSNSSRQPEFTLRAVSFLAGNAFISSSPFCFSFLCLFLSLQTSHKVVNTVRQSM